MLRNVLLLLGSIGLLVTGYVLNDIIRMDNLQLEKKTETSATVLLERVETVAKLITVEGFFSEVYEHKDYYSYDISFLRKKALLRVKARVSVGYDLGAMQIQADEATKTVTISNLPDPTILSIDHEVDYYDLSEGAFNQFSEEDFNQLNQKARNFILAKAEESDLFDEARQQGKAIVETIAFLVEASGWTLITEPAEVADESIEYEGN